MNRKQLQQALKLYKGIPEFQVPDLRGKTTVLAAAYETIQSQLQGQAETLPGVLMDNVAGITEDREELLASVDNDATVAMFINLTVFIVCGLALATLCAGRGWIAAIRWTIQKGRTCRSQYDKLRTLHRAIYDHMSEQEATTMKEV